MDQWLNISFQTLDVNEMLVIIRSGFQTMNDLEEQFTEKPEIAVIFLI